MTPPFAGLLPDALLIDLPEIDAQHDQIFGRIEALKAACYGSGPAPLEDFQGLLDYPVSYTHLDVSKRQPLKRSTQ